jgi:phosphoribosylformylglycinamidine synthase
VAFMLWQLGDKGVLLHIDIGKGKRRLGGSCLAQVYDQVIIAY